MTQRRPNGALIAALLLGAGIPALASAAAEASEGVAMHAELTRIAWHVTADEWRARSFGASGDRGFEALAFLDLVTGDLIEVAPSAATAGVAVRIVKDGSEAPVVFESRRTGVGMAAEAWLDWAQRDPEWSLGMLVVEKGRFALALRFGPREFVVELETGSTYRDLQEFAKEEQIAAIETHTCFASIRLGQARAGQWTTDCGSVHRDVNPDPTLGSHAAKYYLFTVSSRTRVRVDLTSTIDAYLFLLSGHDPFGEVLAFNDDRIGSRDSRVEITLEAGDYTIEATTFGAAEFGPFRVAMKKLGGKTGQTTVSWTIEDDCPDGLGLRLRFFDWDTGEVFPGSSGVFTVGSGQRKTFSLRARRGSEIFVGAETNPPFGYYWGIGPNGDQPISDPAHEWVFHGSVPTTGRLVKSTRLICP